MHFIFVCFCSHLSLFYVCFFQPIDYEGFHLFMETYLDCEVPEELCKHLFLSFMKKPSQPSIGKDVKDVVAAMASQTVCGAVGVQSTDPPHEKHHGLAEKLHGLSEKLHSLGHMRHDSSGGEPGKRSRAGRKQSHVVHNALCPTMHTNGTAALSYF